MNYDGDGYAVVSVHLGAPESFDLRVHEGSYSPFVAISVTREMTLYCGDPDALAALGRTVWNTAIRIRRLFPRSRQPPRAFGNTGPSKPPRRTRRRRNIATHHAGPTSPRSDNFDFTRFRVVDESYVSQEGSDVAG